jgi:hypothetical protein
MVRDEPDEHARTHPRDQAGGVDEDAAGQRIRLRGGCIQDCADKLDHLDGEVRHDGKARRNAEIERPGTRVPFARACEPADGIFRPHRPEPRRRDDLGHFDLPSAGSPVLCAVPGLRYS